MEVSYVPNGTPDSRLLEPERLAKVVGFERASFVVKNQILWKQRKVPHLSVHLREHVLSIINLVILVGAIVSGSGLEQL